MTADPTADPLNGLFIPPGPPGPPDLDPLADLAARVDALTTRLQLVATAVAGILAQQAQPQIQQAILAQLTGQAPTPP